MIQRTKWLVVAIECGRHVRRNQKPIRGSGCCRRSGSSSSSSLNEARPLTPSIHYLPPSMSNLGVWEACVMRYPTVIPSIQQLPEVEPAIQKFQQNRKSENRDAIIAHAVDVLQRSVQIFGSIASGSKEHTACLALLAEIQFHGNMSSACYDTLSTLHELIGAQGTSTSELEDSVRLAQAKAHWLNGDPETAATLCTNLLLQEKTSTTTLETALAARTGQALARLLQVSSLDDAFGVRDPFRGVLKHIERDSRTSPTINAAAYLNMGIAEAVYAETVARHNNVDVPLDSAMRAWKAGLTELKRNSRNSATPQLLALRTRLQARLQANMAWGMLHMTRERDYLERASRFATESLATHDSITNQPTDTSAQNSSKEGLSRTLSLLATCYHKSGNAVTAQGLFQSALDHSPIQHPTLASLERRDALEHYAQLCREWDKRQGEADQLQQQADTLDASLPSAWQGKSAIHGSLWFWTPEYAK